MSFSYANCGQSSKAAPGSVQVRRPAGLPADQFSTVSAGERHHETQVRYQWAGREVASGYEALLSQDWYQQVNRRLLDMAPTAPGEFVIDLGCGPGSCLEMLANSVGSTGTVMSIDVSPDMINAAMEKALHLPARCLFAVNNSERLSGVFPGSADKVYLFNSIYHLPDPYAVLRDLFSNILIPGGVLAFNLGFVTDAVLPEHRREMARLARSVRRIVGDRADAATGLPAGSSRNIYSATSDQYRDLCEKCGFKILEARLEPEYLTVESAVQLLTIPGFGQELLPSQIESDATRRKEIFTRAFKDSGLESLHRQWFFLVAQKPD